MENLLMHPDLGDLHDYFSSMPTRQLTQSDRASIAKHISQCSECAAIEEEVKIDDENWNSTESVISKEDEKRILNDLMARTRKLFAQS